MRTQLLLSCLASLAVASACGGSTSSRGAPDGGGTTHAEGGAGGGDAGGGGTHEAGGGGTEGGGGAEGGGVIEAGGGGDGGACSIDAPGSTFTFHVHNTGTRDLGLAYGCGGDQPIVLATPAGSLGIGPESANSCGFTCSSDYAGPVQQGCSDCGPGVGADLAAGATVDISWGRLVYTTFTAPPQCVGGQSGVSCALAKAVAPSATQAGVLTVCTGGASSGGPGGGYCSGSETVNFTVDTTQSEGTIAVQ